MSSPAEFSHTSSTRGSFQEPHTVSGDGTDGGHVLQRTLAVKLDPNMDEDVYQWLKKLSSQSARYWNHHIRALWAEAKGLCADPVKAVPNDVTKKIRHEEKMDLGSRVYAQIEREVYAAWKRHVKHGYDNAPLPERKPTSALVIRGHNENQGDSGIRISQDEKGHFIAHLAVRNASAFEDKGWFHVPLATGTVKDYQAGLLEKMAVWDVPITKASLVIKPWRHKVILRLHYSLTVPLPPFGNRVASLSPSTNGERLLLRTECDTLDYTHRLNIVLNRKADWDLIRRRMAAQIGRCNGAARMKRKLYSRMSWDNWLDTYLHTWTKEIIEWLKGQGISKVTILGLEKWDWAVASFTQKLKDKGDAMGVVVSTEADLADPSTERAVKAEIGKRRRKAAKQGKAVRELIAGRG